MFNVEKQCLMLKWNFESWISMFNVEKQCCKFKSEVESSETAFPKMKQDINAT